MGRLRPPPQISSAPKFLTECAGKAPGGYRQTPKSRRRLKRWMIRFPCIQNFWPMIPPAGQAGFRNIPFATLRLRRQSPTVSVVQRFAQSMRRGILLYRLPLESKRLSGIGKEVDRLAATRARRCSRISRPNTTATSSRRISSISQVPAKQRSQPRSVCQAALARYRQGRIATA